RLDPALRTARRRPPVPDEREHHVVLRLRGGGSGQGRLDLDIAGLRDRGDQDRPVDDSECGQRGPQPSGGLSMNPDTPGPELPPPDPAGLPTAGGGPVPPGPEPSAPPPSPPGPTPPGPTAGPATGPATAGPDPAASWGAWTWGGSPAREARR